MNREFGRKFGPYEIQSRLGGGGMGHVYRAWDARLHREVAIKLLNHEYAMPGMRERFLREARAASALNHPNICTIFDIGEQDGDPYLVMELLQGETLKDRILNHTVPLDEIVAVARDTAEALGAAHSKGVVHRDIKPANIFLVDKPNGGTQAKVLDFGLAKIEGGVLGARGRSLELTSVGATVGTLAYMSPEQARGEPLDSRSDLFSLGVVMYEMATRHVPFQGATSALVFVQLLNHAPESVREWNEAVPRELEKIIFKLLAKERTARFQTARELELALIALSDKGSGGWLRKAVSAVPLVRAQDPVAREKRLTRVKTSSDPSLQSPPPGFITPVPLASSEEVATSGGISDQVLRPLNRMPRPDGTPLSARNTPVPLRNTPPPGTTDAGMFTPVPSTKLPSDVLRSGSRQEQSRPNAQVQQSDEESNFDSIPPARHASGDKAFVAPVHSVAPVIRTEFVPQQLAEASGVFQHEERIDSAPVSEELIPLSLNTGSRHRRLELPFQPVWLGVSGLALIFVACVLYVYSNHSRFSASPLNRSDVLALTEVENRTGDRSLDNSVTEVLRFDLAQSTYFTLRSGDSYRAARRLILLTAGDSATNGGIVLARKTAERLGAKAYLFGFVTGSSSPYTVHIDLRDVSSNQVLASAESHPGSLQQIPTAVDQVAGELRISFGEPRSSVETRSNPISSEASSNMSAVQLYAEAEALIADHKPVDASAQLEEAVRLDPNFTQAHLQLAILYQQLRAETAAADSAGLALMAAGSAGERTRALVQAAYERETTGDFVHAAAQLRALLAVYPHDSEALAQLAEVLRLQGRTGEALGFAQQAYAEDAFNAAAYTQAELALIGLDRYDAAYQLNAQAQRLDLAGPGESLAGADLDRRQEMVDDLLNNLPVGRLEYRPDWTYGIYLDSTGRLAAGAGLWRTRSEAAQQNDSLKSAANFLLAQGAMDRALLGDCTGALAMLPPADESPFFGRTALFNSGVASALCEDRTRSSQVAAELRRRYPQSFQVNGYFLADLLAAQDLHDHQPAAALRDLAGARAFDLISLTPFLRGQAHVAQHEIAVGIVDFQTELAHRGVTYIVGSDVYPAAQIGVARAFADSGDLANSGEAYRKFLEMWKTADPSNPLLIEARKHAGI